MSEKRMFAKTIIDSDAFLTMPLSAQALYFHLSMRGDDEGFVNKPKSIMRTIGSNDDDLKLLIFKNFILPFESGVVVIKHWKIHNYIRSDRIKETVYQEEKSLISEKENGSYTFIKGSELCQPNDGQMSGNCQHRLDKISIDKNSIDIIGKQKRNNFKPPTIDQIKEYCIERNNSVNPEKFLSYYESRGWMLGKTKMKDWKAAIRTWEQNDKKNIEEDWRL